MATDKTNGSPNGDTSAELANFPEVTGKIVQAVEIHSDHEFYGLTIRVEDRTALTFTFETAVFAFPTFSDWEDGNETILKKYKSVRSKIQRS